MSVMAVSFTLDYGDDYSKRYDSVVGYLRKQGKAWEETTSFFLVETSKTAVAFENDLWINTDISSTRDKVIVLNVTSDPGATRGKLSYPSTLKALMPSVQQN